MFGAKLLPPPKLLSLEPASSPSTNLDPSECQALRRSIQVSKSLDRDGFSSLFTTVDSIYVPTSHKQAIKEDCWKQAVIEELPTLEANHT